MVQSLKDSASATAHLWNECNSDLNIEDFSICSHYLSLSSGSVGKVIPTATSFTLSTSAYELDRPTKLNKQLETTQEETTNTQLETTEKQSNIQQTSTNTAENMNTPFETTDTESDNQNILPLISTPPRSTVIFEVPEQSTPSTSHDESYTTQPMPPFTPQMIDSTTSPKDKQYSAFVTESLEKKRDEPFTQLEEEVHTYFVKRKVYQNP
ncbi:hypothetical protein PoB_005148400 [Plakobranchus ocellatus]|uniref:Uncharacterized protein n=1 Tax=Plakobranchus ocellatus TaxID=259542 RepID=A0AAV4BXP5_9GAST|nr:hypothetical protein PoB_005148400 [Plakobranchus ocellatus]